MKDNKLVTVPCNQIYNRKFFILVSRESFRHHIRNVLVSTNMIHVYDLRLVEFSDKMETYVYMFRAIMFHRIPNDIERSLIIAVYLDRFIDDTFGEILEYATQIHGFLGGFAKCHVLRFASRQRYGLLLAESESL